MLSKDTPIWQPGIQSHVRGVNQTFAAMTDATVGSGAALPSGTTRRDVHSLSTFMMVEASTRVTSPAKLSPTTKLLICK